MKLKADANLSKVEGWFRVYSPVKTAWLDEHFVLHADAENVY